MSESETRSRTIEKLTYELGPIYELLDDPTVTDIMLNPDGKIWVERLGQASVCVGEMAAPRTMDIIRTVAATMNLVMTRNNPVLECEFPLDGSRFLAVIPPVTTGPQFTIRKKAIMVFTLADYVTQGIMTAAQRSVIEEAVRARKNIMIFGSTGSGKTTLVNAVIRYIAEASPDHRLLILEDTRELQCVAENHVFLKVSGDVDLNALVAVTMRENPDRVIVGEVRGRAAYDMLKVWNTGHPGGAGTAHADSAEDGLFRMEQMVQEAIQIPMPALIARAVNLIIFIEKGPEGRRVKEIIQVDGHDGRKYQTQQIGGNNV
jgi:type IV secretion system protein TrbB